MAMPAWLPGMCSQQWLGPLAACSTMPHALAEKKLKKAADPIWQLADCLCLPRAAPAAVNNAGYSGSFKVSRHGWRGGSPIPLGWHTLQSSQGWAFLLV